MLALFVIVSVLPEIDFFAMTDQATLSRPLAVVFALDISGSLKPEVELAHGPREIVHSPGTLLMGGTSVKGIAHIGNI